MSIPIQAAMFAALEPPHRICGWETEYDIRVPQNGDLSQRWPDLLLTEETARRAQFVGFTGTFSQRRVWLDNAAMLYADVGSHAEYCTPESLGPLRTVAADRAGQLVMAQLIEAGGVPLHVFRRSATVHPTTGSIVTKGFHTNFCIPESVATVENLSLLESHLVTQLYAWGGIVTMHGFDISPKAYDIGGGITTSMSNRIAPLNKPLALLKLPSEGDECDTNAKGHGYARFEDRSKTPSSEYSDFMGAATTSVLLRIFEHPELLKEERQRLAGLQLDNPIKTFKAVARDMGMKRCYELKDGRTLTALNIQSELATIATSISQKLKLPIDELYAVGQWTEIVAKLQKVANGNADLTLISDRIGWAAKYVRLVRKCGEAAVQVGELDALRYCLNWDRIVPVGGMQMHDKLYGPHLLGVNDVEELVHNPPYGTRGIVRSRFIQDHKSKRVTLNNVRWPYVNTTIPDRTTIYMSPYQTEYTL